MISGRDAKSYLDEIITAIDDGRTPTRPTSPWWVRHVAVPTALGISMSLSSCATDPSTDVSKADAAQAKADGWTSDLCGELGLDADCDICEELGWYGDGECDDFCDQTDTADCGGVSARYMAPMPENCTDGYDNDFDGRFDCDDTDCSADPACTPSARYMAPLAEVCDDGTDNDGDGDIDCEDSDCFGDCHCRVTPRYMAPQEICDDGIDNDADCAVDCDDDSCADDPACTGGTPARYMAPF
jgi:hypothetical protein